MTERSLKDFLAAFVIGIHMALFLLVFACFKFGGFDEAEMTTILAITIPMFAGYAVLATSYIFETRHGRRGTYRHVPQLTTIVAFFLPMVFFLAIGSLILIEAWDRSFSNFESFKKFLLILESLFSASLGRLFYSLFLPGKTPPVDDHIKSHGL